MRSRILIATAILIAVAGSAFAGAGKFADWGKGPVQYLMTKEEAAQWKAIASEKDAEAFINLFWARRDPTPRTPVNEFKGEFEQAAKYADEHFSTRRVKGSMTDRGRILLSLGAPTRIERTGAGATAGVPTENKDDRQTELVTQTWVYDGNNAQELFGQPRVDIKFADRFGAGDFKLERSGVDVEAAAQKAIASLITQPTLTAAPDFSKPLPPAAPVPPPAPVVMTEFKTPAFQAAVTDFKASKTAPAKPIYVTWGEFVTPQGEYFVPVSLLVPKSAGMTADQKLTFFGVVEDAAGKPVAVFEEPATLTATKEDFYFDKSLTLPAGKLKGTFGLADNGTPITMVSTEMELAGSIDKAAEGVSRLLLSNNIFPMSAAQKATDPFAFGGMKVIPKGDRTFTTAEELWYFVEIRNPGLDEVSQQPKLQAKIDLEGVADEGNRKVKMSQPPSEVQATPFNGMPGHYGIGSAIPLASFRPGKYTMTIKLIDTVTKANYTVKEDFRVVAAPAAPAATAPKANP